VQAGWGGSIFLGLLVVVLVDTWGWTAQRHGTIVATFA